MSKDAPAARHYGTIGLADQRVLSRAYDAIAEHTVLYQEFYDWVADMAVRSGAPASARTVDIGCGNGRMLKALAARGYHNLAGVDFSEGCVDLARREMPAATISQHDMMLGPLGERAETALMTEVVEHVTDPRIALGHVRDSLSAGGRLILTFPNRLAYWPWLYLAPIYARLPRGRLRDLFGYLIMPYEMRSSQPIDHAYSIREVREFLRAQGFEIQHEAGFEILPMLNFESTMWLRRALIALERRAGWLPGWLYYRYMFVCRVPAGA